MNIIEGKQIDTEAWADLVKRSPVATWFQTEEAFAFFDSLSFLEAFAYAVEAEGQMKGLVVGYLQKDGGKMKRFFSRRAIILGGALLSDNISEEELSCLFQGLKERLKKRVIFIEMRNFEDYSRWRLSFEMCGFEYEPHYDVQVDTASLERVNEKLDRNRKRNIKKAVENGLIIEDCPTLEELTELYSMMESLYREKVKTPLFPLNFFLSLRNLESSRFFVAKDAEGKLLGGLVCVCLEGRAVYAWYACGLDQQYRILSPSVMVNYSGICYAANNNYPRFDFMGAGKPDDGGYGVRDFKMKFGGELLELGRYTYVCKPLMFLIGKLGVRIMKKL